MSATNPIDWERIEDALWAWIVQSTGIPGDRVRVLITRDDGEARGPAPKATISLVSLVPTAMQGRLNQLRVQRQRLTVLRKGPGLVGVDFYPGRSLTPQRIAVMAGEGDEPDAIAVALLGELQSQLPDGYTASADPDDDAAVLLDGTEASPLFATSSANDATLSVFTAIPRIVAIRYMEHRLVLRVTFRASGVSGSSTAANAMAKAMLYRQSRLDPAMRRLSFRHGGFPQSQAAVPADRGESTAALDVAFFGFLTGAEAAVAMRAAKLRMTA